MVRIMIKPNVADNLLDGPITTRPPTSQPRAPHNDQSSLILHCHARKKSSLVLHMSWQKESNFDKTFCSK